MASSKLKKAIGAVKDQTSIGIAKVSNSNSISDLDVAIVKATSHNEYPAEERHIREILSLTCYSRNFVSQCVSTLSRRLGKTRSWTVALKTLILIHRLLCEGDPAYEQEIFFATRRGTRMLNLSDFRDTYRSDSWDYSAFVRTYARYLDEMLEYRMHGRRTRRRSRSQVMHEDWNEEQQPVEDVRTSPSSAAVEARSTPVGEMKTESIFTRTQHLQQLLERFLACRPTGSAKHHRIVAMALYPILKESCQLYFDLQEIMGIFVDRFMELELPDCTRVFEIFTRLSKQFDELDKFYSWCKSAGISRPSEFPEITKITQQKLDAMDDLIREKSNFSHKKVKSFEQLTSEEDAEYESSKIKSLPAPEPEPEPPQEEDNNEEEQPKEEESPKKEENNLAIVNADEPVDFLNLRDDIVTLEDRADKFALALFDGSQAGEATTVSAWETFKDGESDWETALVESASGLSGQKATMGGGFDMLLLDGMYSQQRQPSSCVYGEGSASSVVLPKSQSAPVLALPAPESGTGTVGGDPFAASLSVPAPSYVQMTDLEKKQRLMVKEQVMWQSYAKGGMQGEVALAKFRQGGGFAQRF